MTLPAVPQFETQGLTDYLVDLSRAIQLGQQNIPVQTRLQPYSGNLQAFSNLVGAADQLPYFTGPEALALTGLTSYIRSLLDDVNASAALTTLGVSTFIKTLLDDVDALAARTTLGLLWESIGPLIDINNVASVIWTNLSAYRRIRISGKITPVTTNTTIVGHTSNDNGASWLNGAADYSQSYIYNNGATPSAGVANNANITFAINASSSTYGVKFNTEIDEWNKATRGHGITASHTISSGSVDFTTLIAFIANTTTARNAFRITSTSGNLSSGFVTLEGIRG